MNYPFRFKGTKVGDICYWVHQHGPKEFPEDGIGEWLYDIHEVKIEEVDDAFDYAERDLSDLIQERENWAIFYWIDRPVGHALTFGDELFLTREEAEEYIRDCKEDDT